MDCRQDIRESPYFELIVLGEGNHKNPGYLMRKEAIKDIQLEIDEDGYGNHWSHHKMIQGPIVTWRIEPVFNIGSNPSRTIMGIEEKGNISFTIRGIETYGEEGISMMYLRYHNIPDFDDGHMVLFVQKQFPNGSMPMAGIQTKKAYITPPIKWEIYPTGENKTETKVILGDKVGIGTDKPQKALQVHGDAEIKGKLIGNLHLKNGNSGATPDFNRAYAVFEHGGVYKYISLLCPQGHENGFIFSQKGNDAEDAGIYYNLADGTGNGLQFRVGGNKKTMTIAYNQRVGIGTTSPDAKLDVRGDTLVSGKISSKDAKISGEFTLGTLASNILPKKNEKINLGSETRRFHQLWATEIFNTKIHTDGISAKGTISANWLMAPQIDANDVEVKENLRVNKVHIKSGNVYNLLFKSDKSLKKDISPIKKSLNTIEVVRKITPVSYQWNSAVFPDASKQKDFSQLQYGFIANEVEKVLPEIVSRENEDSHRTLNYQALNTILFQAVKDQQKIIDGLQGEVAELRSEQKTMKHELSEIKALLEKLTKPEEHYNRG